MKLFHSSAGGVALGLAVMVSSGCKTSVNTLEPAQATSQREMLADKRVITDASLNRRVRFIGINTSPTNAPGFLKIQVEVQNLTNKRQAFSYRVEWFDEMGMLINLPTYTAIPRTIEGKEILDLTATAPTERAKDFRIKFLESTH
jgi:uncharacterized protein YcfL